MSDDVFPTLVSDSRSGLGRALDRALGSSSGPCAVPQPTGADLTANPLAAVDKWLFSAELNGPSRRMPEGCDRLYRNPQRQLAWQLMQQAQQQFMAGQQATALDTLYQLIAQEPMSAQAYGLAAWVLYRRHQYQLALDYAKRSLAVASSGPDLMRAFCVQAAVQVSTQQWSKGIIGLQNCLKLLSDSDSVLGRQIYYWLGQCYQAQGMRAEAINCLERSLSPGSSYFYRAGLLGSLYAAVGRYTQAVGYYQEALQMLSATSGLSLARKTALLSLYYLRIGLAYGHLGLLEGASEEASEKALEEARHYYWAARRVYPEAPNAWITCCNCNGLGNSSDDFSKEEAAFMRSGAIKEHLSHAILKIEQMWEIRDFRFGLL